MAKPAWKMPWPEGDEPDLKLEDDDQQEGAVVVQRWVEKPDGRFELVELPLTRERYLNPRFGDKLTQGELHGDVMAELKGLLGAHFKPQRDVKVLMDVKHRFGRGLYAPAPDVSIIYGVRHPGRKRNSFNVVKEGVTPSLVIEVVSPLDPRVREMDEVDKYQFYQQVGIPEYLMVDPPRKSNEHRFQLKGHRLVQGCYQSIAPDAQGRLLSETTGLWFGVSADGQRIDVFVSRTGERLLPLEEEREARQKAEKTAAREVAGRRAAEERATRETAARKLAEAELERLRAEVERLKSGG
ncbi:MAG TPA: Uma2 family endonuclease [Thermoanaerobaculia bacterium]|nr:Uma2 family endonuclease [Thermoanaerobaculia bacterium]